VPDQAKSLLYRYLFAATCLTIIIVGADTQSKIEVRAILLEQGRMIENLSTQFCETINQMHRIRGFEVLDCMAQTINIQSISEDAGDD
jgi:hypothetical protein